MNGAAPGIRLFVALPAVPLLAAQVQAVSRALPSARWVPAAALHVTLRYLGDVEAERLAEIEDALARIRKKPFHVEVRGLALFSQGDEAVLYAPVESVRHVTDLCARVTDALGRLGFDFGARPYVPHVTLARLGQGRELEKTINNHSKSISCSWSAESFHLYRSKGMAAPDGGYERLADFALRP